MRYILLLVLFGCNFSFIGDDPSMRKQSAHPTYNNCTKDSQCGDGNFCMKSGSNYIGVCMSYNNNKR